jgi:O-antigen ligase
MALLFTILAAVSLFILYTVLPEKAAYLSERFLTVSTTGRSYRWAMALQWCVEKVGFIGMGIGTANIIGVTKLSGSFHNAYLEIWCNSGLLGLGIVLLFLAIYVFKSIKLVKRSPTEETAEYSRVLLGYILAMVVMGMVEGVFSTAGGIGTCMLVIVATLIDRLSQIIEYDTEYAYPLNEDEYPELECGDYSCS